MANLKALKGRIESVKSTRKITSAMKMVAAAKLRRAQDAIEKARLYAVRLRATLEEVAGGTLDEVHPPLEVPDGRRAPELVAVTSDRGLAGAFNPHVAQAVEGRLAVRAGEFERVR